MKTRVPRVAALPSSFPASDHRFRDVPSDQELEEDGFGQVQERAFHGKMDSGLTS